MPRYHPYSRDQGPLYLRPPNPRAQRALTVPTNAVSVARLLFSLLKANGRSYDEVAEASGILRSTLKSWRHRTAPTYSSIEACFNAIGWHFFPCPKVETLPSEIAADLARLAARMKADLPEVWSALGELAADQTFLRERAKERIEAHEAERLALRNARIASRAANDKTRRRRKPKPANDNIKQSSESAA